MAKSCPKGQYYCFDDKKCKKIPHGYHIGARGHLVQDEDDENGSNNGNGSSNGNGGGNGNGNGGNGGGGMGESFINLPLNIEIPQTQTQFNMGLMFRENLEQDSGMFFIFDSVGEKYFHMKNTSISLDVAFVTEDGFIDSIKELEPFSLTPVSSDGNVLYALEVNRGWFAEHNVKVGDKIIESPAATIENSDGKTFADVFDIVGSDDMSPVVENGVWKGTRQVMSEGKTFAQFRSAK